jgi:hypothetical protein
VSDTKPGADELRVRQLLIKNGVGPDAEPPAAVDWWAPKPEPIVEDEPDPEPEEEPEEDGEEQPARGPVFATAPGYWPRPHTPAFVTRVPERAAAAISPGTRRLLYNATAAGAGWMLGLYHQFAAALADCGTNYSISGALVLGIGGSALIAHVWDRRTRHWWPGIAWAARIPLATALLALALWAPAAS